MIIPGFIISLLTFPGVIVHEWAHKLFCIWTGTPVVKVCYFRFGNPAGFVIHQKPTSVWRHILIGIGPLFVNTATGIALGVMALPFKGTNDAAFLILMWLAMSIAMHSFPSTGDAKSIWAAVWDRGAPVAAKVFGTPLVGLIFVGAIGSIFWLDLVYGVAVVVSVPQILTRSSQNSTGAYSVLLKESFSLNRTLPRMIDSMTRIDTTWVDSDKDITYHFTLLSPDAQSLDKNKLAEGIRRKAIAGYESDPAMKELRHMGVTLHYKYFDENGVLIVDVPVSPSDF